nr:uncharacterized protein LOC103345823 isoform X2 [Oryctolagus cuniculus]
MLFVRGFGTVDFPSRDCIHGGESRSLEKCQESPCAQPVQNSDTSDPFWKQWLSRQQTRPPWRLHTRRRKQKLREMPRIPLCCVPGCPKILTPHTSWSSSLEHVLSPGPKNKEVSSQEQYLQEGPGCWCRRSGSEFNRTLRFIHPRLTSEEVPAPGQHEPLLRSSLPRVKGHPDHPAADSLISSTLDGFGLFLLGKCAVLFFSSFWKTTPQDSVPIPEEQNRSFCREFGAVAFLSRVCTPEEKAEG